MFLTSAYKKKRGGGKVMVVQTKRLDVHINILCQDLEFDCLGDGLAEPAHSISPFIFAHKALKSQVGH